MLISPIKINNQVFKPMPDFGFQSPSVQECANTDKLPSFYPINYYNMSFKSSQNGTNTANKERNTHIYNSPEYQEAKQKALRYVQIRAYNTKDKEYTLENGEKTVFKVFNGTRQGTNEANWVLNEKTGELFYAKYGKKQSQVEAAAAKIYALAGENTPDMTLFKDEYGRTGLLSKYLPLTKMIEEPDYKIYSGLGIDILTENWDALYVGNLFNLDNKAYRSDLGGSFDFRAQYNNGNKPFTKIPDEITTMFSPIMNYSASEMLSEISKQDIVKSFETAVNLKDEDIIKILEETGISEYKETILTRKAFLKDFLEIYKNSPEQKNNIYDDLYAAKVKTLDLWIDKAQTKEDLLPVIESVKRIENRETERILSEKAADKLRILNNPETPARPVTVEELKEILLNAGCKEKRLLGDKTYYKYRLSQDFMENIGVINHSSALKIKENIQKEIYPEEINDICTLMNANNGKYINFWKNNIPLLLLMYQNLKGCAYILDKNTKFPDSAWDYIISPVLNRNFPNILQDINMLKTSNQVINPDKLADFIDNFEADEPITVFRYEEPEIMDKIIPSEYKEALSELLEAGDNTAVNKLLKIITNKGIKLHNKKFISASLLKKALDESVFSNSKVKFELTLNKGVKGIFIDALNLNGQNADECEFLIQRESDIKINDISYNDETQVWNIKASVENTKKQ